MNDGERNDDDGIETWDEDAEAEKEMARIWGGREEELEEVFKEGGEA